MREKVFAYGGENVANFNFVEVRDQSYRWEDSLCFIFVMEGEVKLQVVNTQKTLCIGDFDIIDGGDVYRVFASDQNQIAMIKFHYSYLERFVPNIRSIKFISQYFYNRLNVRMNIELGMVRQLLIYVVKIFYSLYEHGTIEEELIESFLDYFIEKFEISRYLGIDNIPNARFFEESKAYILSRYMVDVSLKELSRINNISTSYLSRQFSNKLGFTFRELINFHKLNRATQLLLSTDMSISDIIYESGYSAERYFYKAFKAFYSGGPTCFRKNYRSIKAYKNYHQESCDYHDGGIEKMCQMLNFKTNVADCKDISIILHCDSNQSNKRNIAAEVERIKNTMSPFEPLDYFNYLSLKILTGIRKGSHYIQKNKTFRTMEKSVLNSSKHLRIHFSKFRSSSDQLMELLVKMGQQVIEVGDQYIVTKLEDGFAVLVHSQETDCLCIDAIKKVAKLESIKLSLMNNDSDYKVCSYKLNNEKSVFNQCLKLEGLKLMGEEDVEIINIMSAFEKQLDFLPAVQSELLIDLGENNIQLLILSKVSM